MVNTNKLHSVLKKKLFKNLKKFSNKNLETNGTRGSIFLKKLLNISYCPNHWQLSLRTCK